MIQLTDDKLVGKSQAGEMDAFKTLVIRHEGKVAGIIRSMLGDTTDAEDVGQEVFIRVYESLAKLRDDLPVGIYVVQIAMNLCLNQIKKRRRNFFSVTREEGQNRLAPDVTMDQKESLAFEFQQLEPPLRAVATLHLVEGFSVEETSWILDIPEATVLLRLTGAQQKLKSALSGKLKGTIEAVTNDMEVFFLKSLDGTLTASEQRKLSDVMDQDYKFQRETENFLKIREMLVRKEPDSFGPFFSERVVHQIGVLKKQIDYQLIFFFKKYQLAVLGIIMALVILNIALSGDLTLNSILGIKEETIDDIINVDIYKNITE